MRRAQATRPPAISGKAARCRRMSEYWPVTTSAMFSSAAEPGLEVARVRRHRRMIRRVGAHSGAAELRRGRLRPEDAELGDGVTRCLLREEVRLLEVEVAQAVDRHAGAPRHHDIRDHQPRIGQSGPGDDRPEAVRDHGQRLLRAPGPGNRRTRSGRGRPLPGPRCTRSTPPRQPGRRPGCRSPSTRRRRSRHSPRRGCAHRGSIPRTGSTRHRHRERTRRRARPSRDRRREARSAAAAGGTAGCRPRMTGSSRAA